MTRVGYGVSGLALLAIGAWATGWVSAQNGTTPNIKEIMTKAHKGPTSLLMALGMQLKADQPEWGAVQKETKELIGLGECLSKNEPPKGEKDSWSKLTQAYVKEAKELDGAAQKQDKKAATAAQAKLSGSCKACHAAHRG
jgi:hypothetical protein